MLGKLLILTFVGTALSQFGEDSGQYQQYNDRERERDYYDQKERRTHPQIISHKQSLNHDGTFKYAFASDNGLLQGESIAPDGSRTGAYAYTDPNGKKISVKYIAGKEGFKILEGDHIPKPPPQQAVEPHPGFGRFDEGPRFRPVERPVPEYRPKYQAPVFKGPEGPPFRFRNEGPGGPEVFERRDNNEVLPFKAAERYTQTEKEPEYPDVAPGRANSFGNGYAFEFAG